MAPLTAAKANLQRLAFVRAILVAVELIAIIYAQRWLRAELPYLLLFGVVTALAIATLLTLWRLRQLWPVTDIEFFTQLLFDVLSHGLLLYASGGATNPFISYFLVPLTIAAAVLPWRYTIGLALICVMLYSALLFFFVPLPLFAPAGDMLTHHHNEVFNPHIFGMWCNFALSSALITYVVVRMANTVREQQRELNLRREQALHNEQLLAVATLAAGTAHELGTPLTTMTVLLDEMCSDDAGLQADIALLKQQVQSCRNTLRRLVSTAESHRQQQAQTQLATEFIAELLERWQVIRPDARYQLCVEPLRSEHTTAPRLAIDEALRQAIINLLDNGADADSAAVRLELSWDDTHVTLRIRDNGPGVAHEIAEQLGKPFVTSKKNGLGLGLFLSHATIERCGGDIRLYTHPEGGTEAVLRLPIAETTRE